MVEKRKNLKEQKIRKFKKEMPWPYCTLVGRDWELEKRKRKRKINYNHLCLANLGSNF